jgi:2-methylcitrate dehydratase PrpD
VRVVVDQEPIAKGLTPCVVDIRTKDGKVYSERVDILRGDPRKPLSMEEVALKFQRCLHSLQSLCH